ncbi:hypothetical protein Ciccas_006667 [Cichlidogyrus casuarinus]|uniref:Uncharacterized protein n=1 Tax=Cichlidogyrus casuarinus TaxID=1844966 RepID=A0ABD2Q658_9PLAT
MGLVDYGGSSDEEEHSIEAEKNNDPDTEHSNSQNAKMKEKYENSSEDFVEDSLKNRVPKSFQQKTQELRSKLLKPRTKTPLFTLYLPEQLDSSDDSEEEIQKQRRNKLLTKATENKKDLLSLLPPTNSFTVKEGKKQVCLVPQQIARPKRPAPTTSDFIPVPDDVKIDPTNYFSFYNSKEEEERLNDVAPKDCSIPGTSSRTSKHKEQISIPIDSPDQLDLIAKFPRPVIIDEAIAKEAKREFEISKLKPGQRLLGEEVQVTNEDADEVGQWNEQTLIPAAERKRAKLARENAIGEVNLDQIIASSAVREVKQDQLTAGSKVELMKNVTADNQQYRGAPPPEFDPGKLATKKHQITWLAYRVRILVY